MWTPDGKHIVFVSQGTTNFSLQWTRADGSGAAQSLLTSENELVPYSFSPDGKRLSFEERNAQTGLDIFTLPLELSEPEHPKPGQPEPFVRTLSRKKNRHSRRMDTGSHMPQSTPRVRKSLCAPFDPGHRPVPVNG